jgi:hypothetical protein
VLKAIASENPRLRYLAGKDVETWMERKKSMSDEDFYKMMKQNFMKWSVVKIEKVTLHTIIEGMNIF